MKQCDFNKHQIFVEEATEAGNPVPGDYTCMKCSSQIVIVENGRFRVEPAVASGWCRKCPRPIDDHHQDTKGNLICGLEERPKK